MTVDEWVVLTIFVFSYILIFSEKVHRATASLLGALLIAGYLLSQNELTESEVLEFIEFDVLILLFGMMVIVGVLVEAGFFSFVALKVAQMTKGNIWLLLFLLSLSTAFMSMVVDNLTTIILFVPVTIEISKTLEINPIPILIAEAIISDIGGVATLIGDPPNVIIASYAGFGFNDFIIHLFPVVLVAIFLSLLSFKLIYRKWIESGAGRIQSIMKRDPYNEIKDLATMKRTLVILGFIIVLFGIHEFLGISAALVALIGAVMTLLINLSDPEKIMHHVEWSSLLFFAGLFIIVGGVDKVGLLREIAIKIEGISGNNTMLAALLILWISAALTAVVDNIPITMAMAPVIVHMAEMGVEVTPLWWALAMGVGFGGNATPIGSSANVVTVGLSERAGYHISLKEWAKAGLPLTFICLGVATLFIVLFFGLFKY